MKITSFSPLIMTKDAENAARIFEELGFEKRHEKKEVTENKDGGFRMKDADGHGVSIGQVSQIPQDMVCVQMNVDDFEEATALLEKHGFKNMYGRVIDTGSSKTAVMASPSGFVINVVHHIKH